MVGPGVFDEDGMDIDGEEGGTRRTRRRRTLVAAVVALLFLLFVCASVLLMWTDGGIEKIRFVSRNVECLQCHTEMLPEFSKATVHNPFALQQCTTCHTPHGTKVTSSATTVSGTVFKRLSTVLQWLPLRWLFSLDQSSVTQEHSAIAAGEPGSQASASVKGAKSGLIVPLQDLCWTCHGSMGARLGDTYLHSPFVSGQCTVCHGPHASNNVSLLIQPPTTLCFTCHRMGGQLERAQTHQPAEDGRCLDCHNPHSSEYRGIIVSSQRELCLGCHPSVALREGMSIQHVPFLNGDCTGCHQPHGSAYTPLLNVVVPDLCYDCHPKLEKEFRQPSHHPVGEKMSCVSCHDPHAAPYLNLVSATGNGFCYQCHTDVSPSFDRSAHSTTRCTRCHTVHGSTYVPLLVKKNPPLCFECHARKGFDERTHTVENNNHPVRAAHYDVNSGEPLTCTSSCHDPHGTGLHKMLRYFDYNRDGTCLMCHAVTKGSRVGIDY